MTTYSFGGLASFSIGSSFWSGSKKRSATMLHRRIQCWFPRLPKKKSIFCVSILWIFFDLFGLLNSSLQSKFETGVSISEEDTHAPNSRTRAFFKRPHNLSFTDAAAAHRGSVYRVLVRSRRPRSFGGALRQQFQVVSVRGLRNAFTAQRFALPPG